MTEQLETKKRGKSSSTTTEVNPRARLGPAPHDIFGFEEELKRIRSEENEKEKETTPDPNVVHCTLEDMLKIQRHVRSIASSQCSTAGLVGMSIAIQHAEVDFSPNKLLQTLQKMGLSTYTMEQVFLESSVFVAHIVRDYVKRVKKKVSTPKPLQWVSVPCNERDTLRNQCTC